MKHILGIETSCDDTSAAMVRGPSTVLSSVVAGQDDLHNPHGGVVPELASRSHVEALPMILDEAVCGSGVGWDHIDAVAVTRGPGLASSLLAGVVAARALSTRLDVPSWTLNHLEAHLYSVFIGKTAPSPREVAPMLMLTVSGGHTNLVLMRRLHDYLLLGSTLDDAAGEALDKAASLLRLGYPGGPAIERMAAGGKNGYVQFPRAESIKTSAAGQMDPRMCFSFSGVKTSLLYYTRKHSDIFRDESKLRDVSASYQQAIMDALIKRVVVALDVYKPKSLACVGGVAKNSLLRRMMRDAAENAQVPLYLSHPEYCTDNAAMVAGLGAALDEAGHNLSSCNKIEPRLKLA